MKPVFGQITAVALMTLMGVGCTSNYWTENSDIFSERLTLDPGSSQRVRGTTRVGGNLGDAEVGFCALMLLVEYEGLEDLPNAIRIQQGNDEPEPLANLGRYRFNAFPGRPSFDDPAIAFVEGSQSAGVDSTECSFDVAFLNDSDEVLELGLGIIGRFGGPAKTLEGTEMPRAPEVSVDYSVEVE